MCLTKSGESGKDCKSAAPEEDKGPEPVIAYFVKIASSFFI